MDSYMLDYGFFMNEIESSTEYPLKSGLAII